MLPGATLGVTAARGATDVGEDSTPDSTPDSTHENVVTLILEGPTGAVEEWAVDVARHLLVRIATPETTETNAD